MATTSHSRGFLSRRLRSMLIGLGGLDLPDCADCHHAACIPGKRRVDTTSYQRTALAEAAPTHVHARIRTVQWTTRRHDNVAPAAPVPPTRSDRSEERRVGTELRT